MQRTRINIFLNLIFNQISNFFANPWRNLSLMIISLLLGFFISSAINTTLGQRADWDITIAFVLIVFTEAVSIIVYRRPQNNRLSGLNFLNSFKIGFAYGLYLEASKLGS